MILDPRPARPEERHRWVVAAILTVGLTIAFHALLMVLIVVSSLFKWNGDDRFRRPHAASKPVVLRGLTAEQFEKNRGADAPLVRDERKVIARKPAPEKKEEKKPDELPKGQIVDVAPGNQQVDPNAKFVAETNNVAKKETRARNQTPYYRNAMPQQTAPQKSEGNGSTEVSKAEQAGNKGRGQEDRPLNEQNAKLAMEIPDQKQRSEISLKNPSTEGPGVQIDNREEQEAVKGNSQRLNLVPGSLNTGEEASAGRAGEPGKLNLMPSQAAMDKIIGGAPNDHLKDIDVGDGTYLTTREWKYASFFNRVKQSVGQQWMPIDQLRMRDPTGNIYGGKDRYTILSITLDGTGKLKDAYVEKASGLDFLDLEAIKAFERASPFPNPPPGIVASDSTIKFQFGFYLELSGSPGMRLFRSSP